MGKKLNLSIKGLSKSLTEHKTPLDELVAENIAIVKDFKKPKQEEKKVEVEADAVVKNKLTKKAIKKQFPSKISKLKRMKIRKDLLLKKLSDEATAKKEVKAKKKREKTVIVKDLKPMLDNLLDIEDEIKKD